MVAAPLKAKLVRGSHHEAALMLVRVVKIDRQEVSGWGCDERLPGSALTVSVSLGGQIIGTAPLDRPMPGGPGPFDGYRRGFAVRVADLGDILWALADGDLRIEVQYAAPAPDVDKLALEVTYERHLFTHRVLCSAKDLFGNADLGVVIDRLDMIARRAQSEPTLFPACFDLISFIRAYFPASDRSPRFYMLAAEISRAAKMIHAARHYEQQIGGLMPPVAEVPVMDGDVLGPQRTECYAFPADLVRSSELSPVELALPPFITGVPDSSFLLECGIVRRAEHDDPAVRTFGFRVNGFGDNDWAVNTAKGRQLVAEKLYRVDFEALRRRMDDGHILVLDMAAEGPYCDQAWVKLLNDAFADLGIPASQVLLLTQNLSFSALARQGGLGAVCSTAHYYLKRGADLTSDLFANEAKIIDYMSSLLAKRRGSTDPRKYTCLNYTPRWPRWATVLSLYCNGHLNEGFVSFPGVRNTKLNADKPEAFGIPNIRSRERYLSEIDNFLELCPLKVDVEGGHWPAPDFVFPTIAFENSFLHIVTETEMSDGAVHRVTEKILKPIVGLQPFLVVGNPFSLKIMRDLGFRTFGTAIDEGYDSIRGVAERFNALEDEILRLLGKDITALKGMTDSMEDIVVHNFLHLVRVAPVLFGAAVETRLRRILAAMARNGHLV